MSLRSSFGWNHDFPRLVRQLGFKFISNKPKVQIDWNLIGCVNIQEVIANAEVYILEKHINDIIYYSLQEEEIRILDPKFVKLFRLAQLTLEYILFCLHYLDRGFVQLQNKLSEQEKKYEEVCKELEEKEKMLQKYKKKVADLQNTCHYHVQDNLKNGEIFQCEICKKIFINEDYLNLHKAKRQHYAHTQPSIDQPPSIVMKTQIQDEKTRDNETDKLFLEIKHLKERINSTEQMLKNDRQKMLDKTETIPKSVVVDTDVQTSLESHTTNYSESFVQCDLLTEKVIKSENEMELIRREIREWREKESNHILNQLEAIKEKFNDDFKKLMESQEKPAVPSYETPNYTPENITSLEQKLDHKLKSNVERLKTDLALQEQKWRTKLAKLEMKSNLITELHARKSPELLRQNSFSITHNTPVTVVKHNSDSNSDQSSQLSEKPRKNSLPVENEITLIQNIDFKSQKSQIKESEFDESDKNFRNIFPNITQVTPQKKVLKKAETDFGNNQISQTVSVDDVKQNKNVTFQNDDTVKIIFTNSDSNDLSSSSPIEQPLKNHPSSVEENSKQKTENVRPQPSQSTLGRHSVTSLKEAVLNNPNFLPEFRKTMTGLLDSSLKELGVDPQWSSIPRETLENHFRTLQHTQKYIAKVYPNYYEIRSDILDQVDKIASEQTLKRSPVTRQKKEKQRKERIRRKRHATVPTARTDTFHHPERILENYMSSPSLIISPKHTRSDIKAETHSRSDSALQTTRSLDRKIQQNSPDLEVVREDNRFRRTKSSQALFSSVLRIKDRVMAAMKSSSTNRERSSKVPEKEIESQEGVYKLTVFNEINSPIPPKILSITPVKRRPDLQKDTKSTSAAHLSIVSDTSVSSDEVINQIINSPRIEQKPRTSSSEPSLSSNVHEPQNIVKPVETVSVIKKDPFIVQFTEPKTTSKDDPARITQNLPEKISMYGDIDEDDTETDGVSFDENLTSSTPKKRTVLPSVLKEQTTVASKKDKTTDNPLTFVKKKVIFNLAKFSSKNSESKSSDSKTKSASITERRDSVGSDRSKRDELPENLIKSFTVVSEKLEESIKKPPQQQQQSMYLEGGDSTSISSSVFDGSIKQTVELKEEKRKDNKDKMIEKSDDLEISDFDFSSD